MKYSELEEPLSIRQIRQSVKRGTAIVGVMTGLVFFATFSIFITLDFKNNLDRESAILRVVVEKFAIERPDSWEFSSDRLKARLEPYLLKHMSYRIESSAGSIVDANGSSIAPWTPHSQKTFYMFGEPVGIITVAMPTTTLLLTLLAIFTLTGIVSVFLAKYLQIHPLARVTAAANALQIAENSLRKMNDSFESVREEERIHLAREIHDQLGQQITSMKFAISAIADGVDFANRKADLISMIDNALTTVRSIAWELRPLVLDTVGLEAALEISCSEFQLNSATRCIVDLPDRPLQIDKEEATQLFRITQELLTNITRHSIASRANVSLQIGPPITLEVADNGKGLAPNWKEMGSLGLLGIQERCRRIGATLSVDSVPQYRGTRFRITLPVAARRSDSAGIVD